MKQFLVVVGLVAIAVLWWAGAESIETQNSCIERGGVYLSHEGVCLNKEAVKED